MFLYLVMGWMIIFTFKTLLNSIDIAGIYLMLSGGIIYTIGAIFYAVGKKKKYMHSIFHFFVLAASILFFFSIFLYFFEIEVSSIGEPMAVLDFIKDTALYVIMNNVVFKDGETIGLTIEQVLTIHLGESEIFDTPTFRIDDPFLTNL